jgi:hypothetical protein
MLEIHGRRYEHSVSSQELVELLGSLASDTSEHMFVLPMPVKGERLLERPSDILPTPPDQA